MVQECAEPSCKGVLFQSPWEYREHLRSHEDEQCVARCRLGCLETWFSNTSARSAHHQRCHGASFKVAAAEAGISSTTSSSALIKVDGKFRERPEDLWDVEGPAVSDTRGSAEDVSAVCESAERRCPVDGCGRRQFGNDKALAIHIIDGHLRLLLPAKARSDPPEAAARQDVAALCLAKRHCPVRHCTRSGAFPTYNALAVHLHRHMSDTAPISFISVEDVTAMTTYETTQRTLPRAQAELAQATVVGPSNPSRQPQTQAHLPAPPAIATAKFPAKTFAQKQPEEMEKLIAAAARARAAAEAATARRRFAQLKVRQAQERERASAVGKQASLDRALAKLAEIRHKNAFDELNGSNVKRPQEPAVSDRPTKLARLGSAPKSSHHAATSGRLPVPSAVPHALASLPPGAAQLVPHDPPLLELTRLAFTQDDARHLGPHGPVTVQYLRSLGPRKVDVNTLLALWRTGQPPQPPTSCR